MSSDSLESFWGTLKNELVHHHHHRYETRAPAKSELPSTSRCFTTASGGIAVLSFAVRPAHVKRLEPLAA